MMSIEIEKYLQNLKHVCPDFGDEELLSFSEGLTTTQLKKGVYFIQAGDQQREGAFLVDGFMRGYHTDESGNIKNIYFIPELEYCFHYASFFAQKPCPLSFQCLENSTIVTFSIAHLQNAYERFPTFQKYGRLLVEEKLRLQQERLESLLFKMLKSATLTS